VELLFPLWRTLYAIVNRRLVLKMLVDGDYENISVKANRRHRRSCLLLPLPSFARSTFYNNSKKKERNGDPFSVEYSNIR